MSKPVQTADICLVLEGTYPYVVGGVSGWVHELIQSHPDLSFTVVALLASGAERKLRYELPSNVVMVQDVFLQELPFGAHSIPKQKIFFQDLEKVLCRLHKDAGSEDLRELISIVRPVRRKLGSNILLDSADAWELLTSMYRSIFPYGSFLDFFWSWRCLLSGLYSVLLPEIPRADAYHAVCTGFAGVFAARAAIETGAACLLTEHGIYTNERRIELSFADWFHDLETHNLRIDNENLELRDYWFSVFRTYSRICYQNCDPIITLFEANKQMQAAEGAAPERLLVIPNGIDYEKFSRIERSAEAFGRTIAMIGRVVPIKGVKTFISACGIVAKRIPDFIAYILGPTDEDPEYFEECREMISHSGLQDNIIFTGRVRVEEYLSKVDVLVLTSISEAQPLVILEAGAAGIPSVTTDVGACREILFGKADESPGLGAGGAVCRVSDARGLAEQVITLLENDAGRIKCGAQLRERVRLYYNKTDQHRAYQDVYSRCRRTARAAATGGGDK